MPVGNRSILEHVVDQLEAAGITDLTFCVGYLSHLIRAVFDNREGGGVGIAYVQEKEALGTAGPLRLVEGLSDTFIVMNGDVLTNLDYRELARYHRAHGNAVTIAAHLRKIKIDYGVLHLEEVRSDGETGHRITEYEEKPELTSPVSMGVYVFEPWVVDYVPAGEPFDFPDLVQALLRAGHPVGAYRYDGLWFDIGRKDDYERAVTEWLEAGEWTGERDADAEEI
jgi:NDP-mannose synthase